ncbi:hypothetical protein VPHD51_0223 [Vibrio phage D51]
MNSYAYKVHKYSGRAVIRHGVWYTPCSPLRM